MKESSKPSKQSKLESSNSSTQEPSGSRRQSRSKASCKRQDGARTQKAKKPSKPLRICSDQREASEMWATLDWQTMDLLIMFLRDNQAAFTDFIHQEGMVPKVHAKDAAEIAIQALADQAINMLKIK